MRGLLIAALLLALGLMPSVAGAAGPFALPTVTLATPGCAIFDADCSLSAGPVATSFGTFSMAAQGDLNAVTLPDSGNGWCMPLSGGMSLTFGSGTTDRLVLVGSTLCYTQPADSAGAPQPAGGPWPLQLTFTVDPAASTGAYVGATGSGSIDGIWSTTVGCVDGDGNAVQLCGLSGEQLAAFTFNSVSIPNLDIPGGGNGGCTVNCGPGGGGQIPGETPELGSVALLGSGLSGLAGYALLRRRARR
jgi:hypothetical protein